MKKVLKKSTIKSWLRTFAIAVAIMMFIVIGATIYLNDYTRHGERFALPSFAGMSIDEAIAATPDMNIRFDVVDSIYVESMDPGVILDQYPKEGNLIKSGRRVTITTNTFSPKNVKIPYVTGYSLRQAKNKLMSSGLQIAKLVYEKDIATNNVLRQEYNGKKITPKSNIIVPINSPITLYVGLGVNPPSIKAPDLLGEPLYIAKNRLWEEGLNVDVNNSENLTRVQVQKAKIFKQYPLPGDSINYGDVILLHISSDTIFVNKNIKLLQERIKEIVKLREKLEISKELLRLAEEYEQTDYQKEINEINRKIDSLSKM